MVCQSNRHARRRLDSVTLIERKPMSENIRSTYPPVPVAPASPQGDVANVGADAGSQINPQWPATPTTPAAPKGVVANVGADSGSQINSQW